MKRSIMTEITVFGGGGKTSGKLLTPNQPLIGGRIILSFVHSNAPSFVAGNIKVNFVIVCPERTPLWRSLSLRVFSTYQLQPA